MADAFIWHELNTTDRDAAAKFYGAVVGWSVQPYPGGGDYRTFMAGDRAAGGLNALPEEGEGGPYWGGYIGVSDVDAEARAIAEAGGAIHLPPQDIPTVGRFAVVADPQGAAFMVMTPLPREDVPPPVAPGTPGQVGWCEIHTTDPDAAWRFYSERFGWAKDTAVDMGGMGVYQTFTADGVRIGGMMRSALPRPQWLYYFAVADIDAAKAAVESGGGTVLHGPDEIPGGDMTVKARDPQGVAFAIVGPRKR